MIRHCFANAGAFRTVTSFALALTLLAGVHGGPAPAFADPEIDFPVGPLPVLVDASTGPVEPTGRLQVIVKSVDVSNDRDGFWTGGGDIELTTSIWRCTGPNPPCSGSESNRAEILAEDKKSFNADSGEFVSLNRVIPSADDVISPTFASEDGGIVVFDGISYLLQINAFEEDFSGGDFMGGVQRIIKGSDNWAVGTYTREPAAPFEDTSLPGRGLLCAGCGDIIVGDYLVTYEIRMMPLPDMHPKAMRVQAPGGPQPQVCATIENLGSEAAEAYGMIFTVDSDPTSRISGRLNPNQSTELCVQVDPIAVGNHTLGITVDPDRAIAESNEKNNVYTQTYVRRVIDDVVAPTTGGVLDQATGSDPAQPPITRGTSSQGITQGTIATGPILTAPGGAPNLQVTTIRVKGKSPGGQNDCDPGENEVTVIVKNQGNAAAASLTIQLEVDGKEKDALEKSAPTLNPGQELSVIFNDVDLKSDDHTLVATVESNKAGAEDGSTAELKATVSCKNEKN